MRSSEKKKKSRWRLIVVYLILSAIVFTAGEKVYGYYQENRASKTKQAEFAEEAVQVNPLREMLTDIVKEGTNKTISEKAEKPSPTGVVSANMTEELDENAEVRSNPASENPGLWADSETKENSENESSPPFSETAKTSINEESGKGASASTNSDTDPLNTEEDSEERYSTPRYAIDSIADTKKARTYMEAIRDLLKATDPRLIPPISVDFETLKAQNEDIVGWIYCEDTPINYPILQGEMNKTYLHLQPDKTYNASGSIFLDCKNASDFSDVKSIIYGHNMRLGTMFGSLKNYKQQEYYDEHPVMYLFTPDGSYMIELFAGIVLNGSSKIYDVTDEETQTLIEKAKKQSTFTADVEVTDEDQLLLLSTCSYEKANGRYMLLGVMRPIPQWLMNIQPILDADFQIDDPA